MGNSGATGQLEIDIAGGKEAGACKEPTSSGGNGRQQQTWRDKQR